MSVEYHFVLFDTLYFNALDLGQWQPEKILHVVWLLFDEFSKLRVFIWLKEKSVIRQHNSDLEVLELF